MEKAPRIVFYDFGCQLEEYCLNRESGFFKETQFFHDAFHGYGHTCPSVYSSLKSITDKRLFNESICEQFNAFLQNIRASSKHMNQVNFTFFAQFMIDIWNEKKKKSFLDLKSTAQQFDL